MADKKTAPLLLNVDASEVLTQTGELLKLLELPASSFEGIPEHVVELFFDRVRGLIDNIVLSDFSTTVGTTDANKICIKVEIIGTLEHLASAIRASNFHSCQF